MLYRMIALECAYPAGYLCERAMDLCSEVVVLRSKVPLSPKFRMYERGGRHRHRQISVRKERAFSYNESILAIPIRNTRIIPEPRSQAIEEVVSVFCEQRRPVRWPLLIYVVCATLKWDGC